MTEAAVFGAVAGAIVAWAASQAVRDWQVARLWWNLGALLMVAHSAVAFLVFYSGSHAAALAATARQTAALMGVAAGAGLYVNYAFLTLWVADATWWWAAPASYLRRRSAVGATIRGVFFFMFLNGAVIFADGWMRVLGVAACAAVAAAWVRKRRLSPFSLSSRIDD
jgi:hypothetical protein